MIELLRRIVRGGPSGIVLPPPPMPSRPPSEAGIVALDPEREQWVPGRRRFLFLGGMAAGAVVLGVQAPLAVVDPLTVTVCDFSMPFPAASEFKGVIDVTELLVRSRRARFNGDALNDRIRACTNDMREFNEQAFAWLGVTRPATSHGRRRT